MMGEETYLGDGLYAYFDGYSIRLRAPRVSGDDEVYLEPEVVKTLRTWMAGLEAAYPVLRARWKKD